MLWYVQYVLFPVYRNMLGTLKFSWFYATKGENVLDYFPQNRKLPFSSQYSKEMSEGTNSE